MQVDRSFSGTSDKQQRTVYDATLVPARTSVWIDPVEQHNVSASYVKRERVGQKRRKEGVSDSVNPMMPISPITPIPSTPIPPRSNSLPSKVEKPSRSLLHPESTVSRAKNASLSPHRAIANLDTVPPITSVERIEQAIDEIDTILPVSPSIDEIDTIPVIKRQLGCVHTGRHPAISLKKNEVDIDEIDTLIPAAPRVQSPTHPRQVQTVQKTPAVQTEGGIATINKMPPVVQMSPVSREVSWTVGAGAKSELAQRIASRARDKQGKSLGELIVTPLSELRWWLLYPGRMEFMLWISGALILLCVTCVLLFATLASSGIIRFNGMDASTGRQNGIHSRSTALSCADSLSRCHTTKSPPATSTTNQQRGSSTGAASSIGTAPAPLKTPGTSNSNTPTSGSGASTPVSQTPPVSISPTVGTSPTVGPTRTPPTPSPTATVKPSPTAAITPTISTTPPKPTTTTVHHTDAQTLSLGTAFDGNNATQLSPSNAWMWLALIGYALSMVMLGLAALLYRRKRRLS